jgi:hypothetical protein
MPRKRTVESDDARAKRLKGKALRAVEDSTTEDADLDAMVKRSIALYGA